MLNCEREVDFCTSRAVTDHACLFSPKYPRHGIFCNLALVKLCNKLYYMKHTIHLYLAALVTTLLLNACKKNNAGTNNEPSGLAPLISNSGWERVRSIKFSDANALAGGFQAEDLLVKGDSVGVLFGEVYDYFGGLSSSGAREYSMLFSMANNNSPQLSKLYSTASVRTYINFSGYNENLVFASNGFTPHLFATWTSSSQVNADRSSYSELDEQGNTTVPVYSQYKYCYQKQNIARCADGSVMFIRANPLNANGATYLNYYDVATHTWLATTAAFDNGMNVLSPSLPGNPPLVTGSWGFTTGNGQYRAMLTDYNGGISIVKPNLTNRHFDTLAHIQEAALSGSIKNQLISGMAYGNSFFGLLYNEDQKKLYEFKWTEGSNSITRIFGDITLDNLQAPISTNGNWKFFEIKPDGTAYAIFRATASSSDLSLVNVNTTGVKKLVTVKGTDNPYTFITLPRYSNGYYYAVAYIPYLTNFNVFPQLDVIRIKE